VPLQVRCRALAAVEQVLTAGVEHSTQAAQHWQVRVGAETTGGGPGDSEVVQGDLPVPVSLPSVQTVQPGRQSGWHRLGWASFEHRTPQVETVGTQPGIGPLLTVTSFS
jgi:hypothetical protein